MLDEILDQATAARTIVELKAEIETLKGLETLALAVRRSGTDKKWTELAHLLSDIFTPASIAGVIGEAHVAYGAGVIPGPVSSPNQKLVVFTEHRDTLSYLKDRVSTLLGRPEAIVIIVGDDAQLPPIGSGNPLSDAIALHLAPTVMLTRIYRQRDDQAIALIANDVRRGIIPDYSADYEDFVFEGIDLPDRAYLKRTLSTSEFEESIQTLNQHILARIAEVTLEHLPTSREYLNAKELRNYLGAFQVISPMRGNQLGVHRSPPCIASRGSRSPIRSPR